MAGVLEEVNISPPAAEDPHASSQDVAQLRQKLAEMEGRSVEAAQARPYTLNPTD